MRKTALVLLFAMIVSMPVSAFSKTQEKIGLAVLDVDAIGISVVEAKALSEKLRSTLSQFILNTQDKQWNNYELIERSQMEKIFEQFEIQNTGCTDVSCAVEFGKVLNADRIIIGSVSHIGQSFIIALRLIDIETSKIIKSADSQHRGEIDEVVNLIGHVGMNLFTDNNDNAYMGSQLPANTQHQISRNETASSKSTNPNKPWLEFRSGVGYGFNTADYYDNESSGQYMTTFEILLTNKTSALLYYSYDGWKYLLSEHSYYNYNVNMFVRNVGIDLVYEPRGRDNISPLIAIGFGKGSIKAMGTNTSVRTKAGVEFGKREHRWYTGIQYNRYSALESDSPINEYILTLKYERRLHHFIYYAMIEYEKKDRNHSDLKYKDIEWKQIRIIPLGFGFSF